MRNRRTRRAQRRRSTPLPLAAFRRELTKVVEGDPSADPGVKEWWGEASRALGLEAAVSRPHGIGILRRIDRPSDEKEN